MCIGLFYFIKHCVIKTFLNWHQKKMKEKQVLQLKVWKLGVDKRFVTYITVKYGSKVARKFFHSA